MISHLYITQVEDFAKQCSPDQENLCLYGHSDGTWEVTLPCEEVPPELPEPAIGINFARDGMKRNDWISLVSVHSDSWLMAVAFYNGARLDQEGRRQLFNDINSLPTCFEIVSGRSSTKPPGTAAAQVSKKTAATTAATARGDAKRPRAAPKKYSRTAFDDDEGGGAEEKQHNGGSEPCPNCGRKYRTGEFWIACDFCDRWYDGQCVGMTDHKADKMPNWKCPFCASEAP